jgi:putative ABC transport system substrate-binding protein
MKRRDFIQIVAGSASGWPLAAHAQSQPKWRVGYLTPSDHSAAVDGRIAAFRNGLAPASSREAADVEIVVRTANHQIDRLPALAADLAGQGVKAIFAIAAPAIRAARQVTPAIPVVALDLESDPVTSGWAISLAHPGANLTGIFLDLPGFSAKTLQLVREAVPGISRVAVLWHPASGALQLQTVRNAAPTLNLTMEVFEISRPADYDDAFQAMVKGHAQGLLMLSSPLFGGTLPLLADLALRYRLPTISLFPEFAHNGGLIGYGPDLPNLFTQGGGLTRKVLLGAEIADLPIERPTRFKLVANLKTASALGLTLPTSILLSADEAIE